MVVGLLEMEFHLSQSSSLKDKRQVIKSLLAQLQRKFQVAAAEVDYQDLWQRTLIGVAYVASDTAHTLRVLESARRYGEDNGQAELLNSSIHLFRPGEHG